MPNQITITGTVYSSDGSIASGSLLTIKKIIRNGQLLSNAPINIRSNRTGYIEFTTFDNSYLWIYSKDISGFDQYEQGTPVYTSTASVQSLGTLASFTGLLPTSIPVLTNSGDHSHDQYTTTSVFISHTGDSSIHFTADSLNLAQYALSSELGSHTGDATIHFTSGSLTSMYAGATGSVSSIVVFNDINSLSGYESFTYDHSGYKIELNPPNAGYAGYTPNDDGKNKTTIRPIKGSMVIGNSITSSPMLSTIQGMNISTDDVYFSQLIGYNLEIQSTIQQVIGSLYNSTINDVTRGIFACNNLSQMGSALFSFYDSIVAGNNIYGSGFYPTLAQSIINGSGITIAEDNYNVLIAGDTLTSYYVYTGVILGNKIYADGASNSFTYNDGSTLLHITSTNTFNIQASNGLRLHNSTRAYVDASVQTPVDDNELATKAYVDANSGGGNAGLTGTAGQIAVFSGTSSATGLTSITSDNVRTTIKGGNVEIGYSNTLYTAKPSIAVGWNNTTNSTRSNGIAVGLGNTINSTYGVVVGYNNNCTNNYNYIFGSGNQTNVSDAYAIGRNGTVNHSYSLMISTDTAYSISTNAIHFQSRDGGVHFLSGTRIYLTSDAVTPTASNELVTKQYVDSQMKDTIKYITELGSTTGDIHLSNANWNTSYATIKYIRFDTTSTAYSVYLLQNDNGYATDDATIPALQVANNAYQSSVFYLDHPYWDEDSTDELHMYWTSSDTGSVTANIYVVGVDAK